MIMLKMQLLFAFILLLFIPRHLANPVGNALQRRATTSTSSRSSTTVTQPLSTSTSSSRASTASTISSRASTASTTSSRSLATSTASIASLAVSTSSTRSGTTASQSSSSGTRTSTSVNITSNGAYVSSAYTNPQTYPTIYQTNAAPTPSPVQVGIQPGCVTYYKALAGDNCTTIVNYFSTFNEWEFISWNPAVGGLCTNIISGDYYCVQPASYDLGPPIFQGTPNASLPNCIIQGCSAWYLAQPNDTCSSIPRLFDYQFNYAKFMSWNPSIGWTNCSGFAASQYYCVGWQPQSSNATSYLSGPNGTNPTYYPVNVPSTTCTKPTNQTYTGNSTARSTTGTITATSSFNLTTSSRMSQTSSSSSLTSSLSSGSTTSRTGSSASSTLALSSSSSKPVTTISTNPASSSSKATSSLSPLPTIPTSTTSPKSTTSPASSKTSTTTH